MLGPTSCWAWRAICKGELRRNPIRKWVDQTRGGDDGARGPVTVTEVKWAEDGGLYGEGMVDMTSVEMYLAELGVGSVKVG